MAEKCIIKTCVKKETAKGTFYTIELLDGRKGSSFDDLTGKMGMEIELEVKDAKEFEGVMQYYFNLPKTSGQVSKFTTKDYTFDKRRSSYELALKTADLLEVKLKKSEDIYPIAERIFEYLNKR